MHNEWNTLPDSARLWIYGANRILNADEQVAISEALGTFCGEWSAHGEKLRCGFTILHNSLIVLAVDEQQALASGCSIDSSVAIIRTLDADYQLDLFNRLRVYIMDGDHWKICSTSEFKNGLADGTYHSDTPVFDTTIQWFGVLKSSSVKPVQETWLSRFIPASAG
ncbi:MAG: hypothetical protein H6608_06315 [Flavobacteriales bacterium]|nr:hypothetical protein [Flavobacteriales bacterium]